MSSSNRRWFRFSLRTLLIIVTGLCIFLGVTAKQIHDRRAAISAIDAFGGGYSILIEGPEWLRNLVEDEKLFWNLGRVSFSSDLDGYDPSHPFDDDALRDIIPYINRFSHFYILHLVSLPVTDNGLSHLKTLKNLKQVLLINMQVTDEGLKILAEIESLEYIWIQDTAVTAEGVARLRSTRPDCEVVWSRN